LLGNARLDRCDPELFGMDVQHYVYYKTMLRLNDR